MAAMDGFDLLILGFMLKVISTDLNLTQPKAASLVTGTLVGAVIGGFIFLVAIIDLFSRKVVGWSLGDRLDAELAGEALHRALARRSPRPGLVFHSDRGSEFAAASFRKLLAEACALQSMSRKGDCWDNAVAESFFSTLKAELVHRNDYVSRSQARDSVFDYIEAFYNGRRRHSALGYVSPVEHESAAARHADAVAAQRGAA